MRRPDGQVGPNAQKASAFQCRTLMIFRLQPDLLMEIVASDQNIGRPLGYAALIEALGLTVPAPLHRSTLGQGGRSRHALLDGTIHESFPPPFAKDPDDLTGQLVFALKYDGVDLLVLRAAFEAMGANPLEKSVAASPTSAYLRRLWFFYEFLTDERLDIADVMAGPYVDLLEPEAYVTRQGPRMRRQRINFNLLGSTREFCPVVRQTARLKHYEALNLQELASSAIRGIPQRDLQRAIRYLYVKETRSSFEIERATPSARTERFVETLFAQGTRSTEPLWWGRSHLIELAQAIIADARFAPTDYRVDEVRVSEQRSLSLTERVHYVAPRYTDLEELMGGFLVAWKQHHLVQLPRPAPGALVGADGKGYAVRRSCGEPFVDFVVAGCLSFGFVYLHPFNDGNGRIHRLILHRVLSTTGFTPAGVVIPVSAAILNDTAGYDAALEAFSARIMPFVQYRIDDKTGALSIENETAWLYRYPDLTTQVEALCGWFETAVSTELVHELAVLHAIDAAKAGMREVVELPDQREDLFLKLCVQSERDGRGFVLSKAKRAHFSDLSDDEVASLEAAIAEAFAQVQR
jgi:hypothetical protein